MVNRFRRVIKRQQRNHLLDALCSVSIGTQFKPEQHPRRRDIPRDVQGDSRNTEGAMGNRFAAQDRFAEGAQFIDGRLCPGTSGRMYAVVNPATGEELLTYELAGAADVDAAVAAALAAYPGWAGTTPGGVPRRCTGSPPYSPTGQRNSRRPSPSSAESRSSSPRSSTFRGPSTTPPSSPARPGTSTARRRVSTAATTPPTYAASRSVSSAPSRPGTIRSRWPPGRSFRPSPRATRSC